MRTVFDHSNAPYANLVVGEVIGFPGKWSSYPPHWHPQPEIYFYRFLPENGYGFAELSEDVVKTHNNSTVLITKKETHPQTTAPGLRDVVPMGDPPPGERPVYHADLPPGAPVGDRAGRGDVAP